MATSTPSTTVGTGIVNSAQTQTKINTLIKQGKLEAAALAAGMFGLGPQVDSKNMDRYTKNLIQTLFSPEIVAANISDFETNSEAKIAEATSTVTNGIRKATNEVVHDLISVKENIHKILEPVSSITGQTLGNLTNVLKDPIGAPFAIGQSLVHMVDKVNPGFSDRLDATFKKYKTEDLQHLPTQIMGGLRSLASTVDAILSLPFAIAEDIYQGLMEIMQELADALDSILGAVFDLFFGPEGVLDSLFGLGEIMEFLTAVSEVLSFVGGITSSFSGLTQVTNYVSMGQSYLSQAGSVLSNPLALAQSYIPAEASQFTGYLRDPQQVVNQLIPPEINDQLQKIGSISGLGLAGNFGYGVEGILSTMKNGVITGVLDQFEAQAGILGPLLGKSSNATPMTNTQQGYPPTVQGSSINPNIPVDKQGVPVQLTAPPPVLPAKNDTPSKIIPKGQSFFNFENTALQNNFSELYAPIDVSKTSLSGPAPVGFGSTNAEIVDRLKN
tara:strand:- start:1129 stop:2625 length:1497 start_codon:yes stop_codon:yes gene_type:complete